MNKGDTRSRLTIRIDALQRLFMWHLLSGAIPFYLVTEFPKSGGSWVAQMISECLEIPFPRNKRPLFRELRKPCVLHGHHSYSSHFKNPVCVIRDGRDVMVSAYYHSFFYNDRNVHWLVDKKRSEFSFKDFDNIEDNLPIFIKYMFIRGSGSFFRHRWNQFNLSWFDKNIPIVRYEELLRDCKRALTDVLFKLSKKKISEHRISNAVEKYSFKNLSLRKPGEEDSRSFIRKGIAGDWKIKFSKKASKAFDYYAGDALIKLGYENDRRWINRC